MTPLVAAAYLMLSQVASVLGSPSDLGIPDNSTSQTAQLSSILNVVYLIAGAIAVLMVVIAGITYVTAAGNPSTAAKARNTIIYSVAGLVLIGLAFTITNFIIGGVAK